MAARKSKQQQAARAVGPRYLLSAPLRLHRCTPRRSWVIWTVAGVLFGAVMTVMRLLNRKK